MSHPRYEFLIVGSGAGGATLARELGRRGRRVLVVERGRTEQRLGSLQDALRFYDSDLLKRPRRSREGTTIWRTFMAGGSTMVSCGNGTRCLEAELAALGVPVEKELDEVEREAGVTPLPEELLSEGSRRIRTAAGELGRRMEPMPKFVDPDRCQRCGLCIFGCPYSAKWTAGRYLEEARRSGVELREDTRVHEVIVEGGRARGVRARSGRGVRGRLELRADTVILAAGGLGTPVLLQRAGIPGAGEGLFADLFVNVYGVTRDASQTEEPLMPLVDLQDHRREGFLLSPFILPSRMTRVMELGLRGLRLPTRRLIGLMVKTADDPAGRVLPDGGITKPVTDRDRARLDRGASLAREILVRAGADPGSIVVSGPQGGHPGGTAALGRVVDSNLRTPLEGLYACDASVLPAPPGLPPILTLAALAKRLARILTD